MLNDRDLSLTGTVPVSATRCRASRLLPLAGALVLAACAGLGRSATVGRPNIIVIMTDDQGLGDLGGLGNPVLETPNIDRLAAQSARVANFYVSPVCTPTRASLMTGRYAYRTRAVDTFVGRSMMDPGEATIAELLGAAGYRTGIFGKWHLGDCYPMRAMDQGFDESLVLRGGGLAQPSEPRENARRYTNPILFKNGTAVATKGYCTDVYFDAAIEFLRADRREPFLVYLPTNAPHTPLHDVPQQLYDKYRERDLADVLPADSKAADEVARVYAMIENIDQNVGRLLTALDESAQADNTIVVYLHDNGPQQPRFTRGLRGTKGSVFEGGIRSPLFVRWPGRLEPGEDGEHVGAHIDIVPTLLDLAGIAPPAHLRFDGRSLKPLLMRRASGWPERQIVLQVHRGDVPVRGHHVAVRGPRFKLVHPTGFDREAPADDVPWQLYDLREDPGERVDLAADYPDVVANMRASYDAWFDDVSSTRADNYAPPRIVVGGVRERDTVLTRQDWRRVAGGGWGSQGRWLLSFAGEYRFDVRVITSRPLEGLRAELTIGASSYELEVAGPTDTFTFEGITVPAGNAALQVDLTIRGEPRDGPYQVFVSRR